MDVSIPLAAGGARFAARLGLGLVVLGVVAVVLAALTGGTRAAGIDVPAPVGAIAGAVLLIPGLLLWRWAGRRREGDPAIWSEGDVLFLHAHAGPVLRVRADDLEDVTRVRAPGSAPLRIAFGGRMFTVRSNVPVSPGVNEVPVGARYVGTDLDAARNEILDWLQARRKTV